MSKSEIKSAMESLQVGKPFRLSTRAPVFARPLSDSPIDTLVESPTQVVNATQVQNHTQVDNQTRVLIETTVEESTWVGNSTRVVESAPVEKVTQVEKPTQVAEATPVESKTMVQNQTTVGNHTQVWNHDPGDVSDLVALTRRATEQDSSVVLEARAVDGLEKGYTRVPNSVLMKLVAGDFTRNEIKLALLIARFTISFQRKLAPLSKMVLERRSGLRGPAVLEAVSGLVSKGLIEKQQGDQHRPNLLGLVLPADWDELIKTKRKGLTTLVANPTQVENLTSVPVLTTPGVVKSTGAGIGNPTYFKDIKTISKNNSFSELPEPLQKYFGELKPAKKRESEWRAFKKLLGDYAPADIGECLEFVHKRGVGNGEDIKPCHSPMAFLSKAIGDVLPEVKALRQKALERADREGREAENQRKRVEMETRETAEWIAKEQAFEKAFPGEERQSKVLAEFLQGLPFGPESQMGRSMGIGKWWDEFNLE